jgi:hypothetical protein
MTKVKYLDDLPKYLDDVGRSRAKTPTPEIKVDETPTPMSPLEASIRKTIEEIIRGQE